MWTILKLLGGIQPNYSIPPSPLFRHPWLETLMYVFLFRQKIETWISAETKQNCFQDFFNRSTMFTFLKFKINAAW